MKGQKAGRSTAAALLNHARGWTGDDLDEVIAIVKNTRSKMPKRAPKSWSVQDAKAHFSELLEASITDGPQIITRRGVETAVLVSVEKWRRLEEAARPTLKELLLSGARSPESPMPPRRSRRGREPSPGTDEAAAR